MLNRCQTILLFSTLAITAGCKGTNSSTSRTARRDFSPPIVAENDVIKAEVRKLQHKKRGLRIWMNLENKTDDTLELHYSGITATAEGRTARGALKVFIARVDKGFKMDPKFYKHMSAPIEFLDLPRMQNVEITITNIRVVGKDKAPDLKFTLPVRNPPETSEKTNNN